MASSRAADLAGLYAVTPEMTDTAALVARAEACLAGGARLLQYRAKRLDRAAALEQARALVRSCRRAGALFIVNDSVELAAACAADGVHVGRDDADVKSVRAALPRAIVGVSCYGEPERAREAARRGADYVAMGSMFASPTKPGATRARLEDLASAKRVSGLPVVAIGGITAENGAALVAAGADMLAVISALFDADDVSAAARAFTRLFATPKRRDVRDQPRAI